AILHRGENLLDQNVLGYSKIGGVVEHIVDTPENPYHQRFNQVGILGVIDALEVEALHTREREAVFYVVENRAVDASPNPFREIAVELLGKEKIGQAAVFWVEQVNVLHGLVDHIVVFGLQSRATIG